MSGIAGQRAFEVSAVVIAQDYSAIGSGMLQEPWQIELIGRVSVRCGDQSQEHFRERNIVKLLALLCLAEQNALSRSELIERLWPEDDPKIAGNRFRVTLHRLRSLLEPPGVERGTVLQTGRMEICLRREAFQCDAVEFLSALKTASHIRSLASRSDTLEMALALYSGEFLPGFEDDWSNDQRARLASLHLQALRDLTQLLLKSRDSQERALPYAELSVSLEPYDEEARCDLILLYSSLGHLARALKEYETFTNLISADLNAEPSVLAQRLAQQLREQIGYHIKPSGSGLAGFETASASFTNLNCSGSSEGAPLATYAASEAQSNNPANSHPNNPSNNSHASSARPPRQKPYLPLRLTRFFGREKEIEALCDLLAPDSNIRLVTLLGPGGVGKTRLAIETVQHLSEIYDNRVYFVALADIFSVSQIGEAILRTLRIAPDEDFEPLSLALSELGESPSLLALDNVEQLLPEIQNLVRYALESVANLHCLVTSRRSIGIDGESEFSVTPLTVPTDFETTEKVASYPGTALFLDRARAANSEFQLTGRNAGDIAWLCMKLEGMPLALELAAARIRVMSVKEMRAQIKMMLDWLVDTRGGKETRQRSLRASVEWSYKLLSLTPQRAFNALSVTSGGFFAELAADLCVPNAYSQMEILPILDELCDASLITSRETDEGRTRFDMLETLRVFGQEQLQRTGLEPEVRMRQLNSCLRLVEETTATNPPAFQKLTEEISFLRSALSFGLSGDADRELLILAARLAAALQDYWLMQGSLTEGRDLLRQASQLPIPDDLKVEVEIAAANLALQQGDYDEARILARNGIAYSQHTGQRERVADALYYLGLAAFRQSDYTEGQSKLEEALALYFDSNNKKGCAASLTYLGMVAWYRGDHTLARIRLEEAQLLYEALASLQGIADCRLNLGKVYRDQGDFETGASLLQDSLRTFRELQMPRNIASALHDLGLIALFTRDFNKSRMFFEESLELYRELKAQGGIASSLHSIGQLRLQEGRLAEAIEAIREALSVYSKIGDLRGTAASLHVLGVAAEKEGRTSDALTAYEEALVIDTKIENRVGIAQTLNRRGLIFMSLGETNFAWRDLRQALEIGRGLELPSEFARSLISCALLLLREGEAGRAVRIAGTAVTQIRKLYKMLLLEDELRIQELLREARIKCGVESVDRLWLEGQELTLDAAATEALTARK